MKKENGERRKWGSLLWIAAGIVSCLYGQAVVSVIGSSSWFNFAFLIFGAFLIVLGLLWKWLLSRSRGLKICLVLLAALCLTVFCVFEGKVIRMSRSEPAPDGRWVIVLGAKVNRGNVSFEFARRIDGAAAYAKEHPDAVIVTTGGKGADEPVSEGAAARQRLIAAGISEERILTEEKSTSTKENFLYALELMRAAGYRDGDSVVVVSSSFHLFRADKFARAAGLENTSYLGVVGKKFLLPQYYVREFAAYVSGILSGDYK